jgi:hypothetical protein
MKQKNYETPKLSIFKLLEDCLTTSGEGVASDVQWIDKEDLFS